MESLLRLQTAHRTHYDLFPKTLPSGPPPDGHFEIDTRALHREFLELQARAHPDLHPARLKAGAAALSSRINEAFKTLTDPLLRAEYILALKNIEAAAEGTLGVEDSELLTMVLEAREQIEEASDDTDLVPLGRENDIRIRASTDVLAQAFMANNLDLARKEVIKLGYWMSIRDGLHNWVQDPESPVVLDG